MRIRRRRSRAAQATDLLGAYLKLKAARKAARGARKAAKGAVAYKVARRTPVVRRIPLVAGIGAGAAAVLAARRLRGGDEQAAPA